MHGGLCSNSRTETHCSGDKVREDLVCGGRGVALVLLEVGDPQGRALLRTAKGALKGRLGTGIGDASLLASSNGGRAGEVGGQLLTGAGAQDRRRSRRELVGHGRTSTVDSHADVDRDRNCVGMGERGEREGGERDVVWSGDVSEARGFWR